MLMNAHVQNNSIISISTLLSSIFLTKHWYKMSIGLTSILMLSIYYIIFFQLPTNYGEFTLARLESENNNIWLIIWIASFIILIPYGLFIYSSSIQSSILNSIIETTQSILLSLKTYTKILSIIC